MKTFFEHQAVAFEATKDLPFYAYHWEMRVGKTLPVIRTVGYQYDKGNIDLCLMTAPGALPLKWSRQDVPEDRPDDEIFEWDTDLADRKWYQKKLEEFLTQRNGKLKWFFISGESINTPKAKKVILKLLKEYKIFLVNDESHFFKNYKSKRTKFVMQISEKIHWVRNLTGTPSTKGPFDLWSQFYIGDPSILGYNYHAHKNRYGVFIRRTLGS